ncbi:hypothetical protein E4O03_10995 [Treponema sp. OMZ 792]|uniref:hypothetical protein n=1 Tax=unclassified Treponema TaxID=2638727 RepID=UPI0020A4EFA1|nr:MULTISPECIES: hypothetical protein [unclassified Treponema]UTC74713.1 hypothetical protein E4O03_10995 [Treponema sp. OMZ 792]UTC81107.1 hypothetical protein E4O07_10895 [Treponema sp. OMZ 798]
MSSNRFDIVAAFNKKDYILNYCEKLFEKNNYKEKTLFKNMPERMVFETEIWMIGAKIRTEIAKMKKDKRSDLLLQEILTIVQTKKYRKGRESFVMLLHYFSDIPAIANVLGILLDDNDLYGFAVKELNKLKFYRYTEKIKSLLENEKTGWIKQELKHNLQNAGCIYE